MKRATLVVLLVFAAAIPCLCEPVREKGLSLHMLPKRVAEASGKKWGFIITLPDGQRPDVILQSAVQLKEYFKSLPQTIQENGIWIVTTHPNAYSDEEKAVLEDVKTMCLQDGIPLFTCRGSKLPNGWERVQKEPNK